MKRDLFRRNAVNLPFRGRDALENGDASDLDEIAEPAFLDQSPDFSKAALVIVVNMPGSREGLKLPAGDPLADTAFKMGVNLFAKAERSNGRKKNALLDTQIPKSPDSHVATDA